MDYPKEIHDAAMAVTTLTDRIEEQDRVIEKIDDEILSSIIWNTDKNGIISDMTVREVELRHRSIRRDNNEYRAAYYKRQTLLFEKGKAEAEVERLRNELQLFVLEREKELVQGE